MRTTMKGRYYHVIFLLDYLPTIIIRKRECDAYYHEGLLLSRYISLNVLDARHHLGYLCHVRSIPKDLKRTLFVSEPVIDEPMTQTSTSSPPPPISSRAVSISPGPSQSASSAVCPAPAETADPSTSKEIEVVDPELDADILTLLGDAPKPDTKFGKGVHKDLALRWQEILDKGLPKEVKEKILIDYLIPENCNLLVAPSLNPEVKAALAESMIKRDSAIMAKQKQLGIAAAALTQAVELTIAKENHTKILKPISDACRLICDSHHAETKTRRGFVVSSINADLRDTLLESKRETLL